MKVLTITTAIYAGDEATSWELNRLAQGVSHQATECLRKAGGVEYRQSISPIFDVPVIKPGDFRR